MSDGVNIPISYYFFLGGFRRYYLFGSMPLSLMHYFDMFGAFSVTEEIGLKYHFIKKGYITIFANAGYARNNIDDFIDVFGYPFGIGIRLGYRSIIGPLEASIVYSSLIKGLLFHLNIGFSI